MVSGLNHTANGAHTNGHHDAAHHEAAHHGTGQQESTALRPAANGTPNAHNPAPPTDLRMAGYFRWKGAVDRLAAAVLLVPGVPLILILILVVRLTSRGTAIYRQVRVGLGGKIFTMYKIRTMVADAEARSGAVWTQPGDPRITLVGRIFRKLHLDELPQLFNVLKGDMSLIGPRPERPEFVEALAKAIDGYLGRITVRPGITGLAQINLPPDTDLDSVRRKLVLDLEYVRSASLSLDVRMFLCTLVRLCGLPGERAMQLFGLRREVTLPQTAPQQQDDSYKSLVVHAALPAVNGHGNVNGHAKTVSNGHHTSHRRSRRLPIKPR